MTAAGLPDNLAPEPEAVVAARHDITPLVDELPGESVPYALHAGEGERYQLGPLHVTLMARPQDTNGPFTLLRLSCGAVPEMPFTSAPGATHLHVLEGHLTLWFADGRREVHAGDSATIPAGTPWSFAARANVNTALAFQASDLTYRLVTALGTPSTSHTFRAAGSLALPGAQELMDLGLPVHEIERLDILQPLRDDLPATSEPFALAAAGGDRGEQFEQVNSFACRPRHTGEQFFAMDTRGARAPYIPQHFHRLHTENFLCLDGVLKLHVNGRELVLTRGDYVHAPAGTIHSFSFAGHNTHMLGLLTTGVFEPFFDWMNTPTREHVQLEDASEPWFPAEAFARVRAELDVEVVGPPPQH